MRVKYNKFSKFYMFLFIVAMMPNIVFADVSKKQSIAEYINKSDLIVYGKVLSLSSLWRENKIFTEAVFDVSAVLKGEHIKQLTFEYMGGTAPHPKLKFPVAMHSSANYEIIENKEYVLLLVELSNGNFKIVGSHGVFSVYGDGEAMYVNEMKKIYTKKSLPNSAAIIESKNMTLTELKDFVNKDEKK